jgi:transposase
MQVIADRPEAPSVIRTNLDAIFASLELSHSTWLITSLSPGSGEKMSKHVVRGGDIAGLLQRFAQLREKALAQRCRNIPIIVIHEAGLDGFWIDRVLKNEGIESHVVDPASVATSRRRRRAKTDKIDGEALVRTLLAYKRGEPRVCAMVKAPTPEEEDHRRLSRERKVLITERVKHVNRIKGLLFSQGVFGYEPLRRDRRRRLDELRTGDGRPLPKHLKAQISRELDRLELLLEQIKAVETERDALLARNKLPRLRRRPCCSPSRASDLSSPPFSGRKDFSDTSTIDAKSLLMQAWRRHPGRADLSIANKACLKQAIHDCEPPSSNSHGYGCAINRNLRLPCGLKNELCTIAAVSRRLPS